MYFHCPKDGDGNGTQKTYVAVSRDGLTFDAHSKVDGDFVGRPYAYVIPNPNPNSTWKWLAIGRDGMGSNPDKAVASRAKYNGLSKKAWQAGNHHLNYGSDSSWNHQNDFIEYPKNPTSKVHHTSIFHHPNQSVHELTVLFHTKSNNNPFHMPLPRQPS